MPKFDSPVREHLANEQPAVTVLWVALAADQGDSVATRALDQTLDGGRKGLLFGHRSVQRVTPGIVVTLPRGTAPKLLAQEQITHPAPSHASLEIITVEVRRVARIRKGPNIDQALDSLRQDKSRKLIELMIRMAYGPDGEGRRHDARDGRDRR
jgi:hypothetical protein